MIKILFILDYLLLAPGILLWVEREKKKKAKKMKKCDGLQAGNEGEDEMSRCEA